MPEFVIDRALATVRVDIASYRHGSSGYDDEYDAHAKRQTAGLRATLAILEAARAWLDAKDRLSGEHPRTLASNRALTEAQLSLERAIRSGQ